VSESNLCSIIGGSLSNADRNLKARTRKKIKKKKAVI
jgi:hypothetical protein